MKGLVIDTALGLCTAAAFDGGRLTAIRSEAMDRGHQERLAGMVRDVAAAAGGFGALDRIGVTVGPGSFTGLRVGLAFAQGLGAALNRPVIGLSTLEALTASVEAGDDPVAALIDARRGQVYARFQRAGGVAGPVEALSLADARTRVAALGAGPWLVGSGAALIPDPPDDARIVPMAGPTAEALARLTAAAPAGATPAPVYLRAPDATPPTRLPGQARPPR